MPEEETRFLEGGRLVILSLLVFRSSRSSDGWALGKNNNNNRAIIVGMMMMEEEEELAGPHLSGDSGNVSQSHSSASGLAQEEEEEEEGDAGRRELVLTAADYAAYLLPSPFRGGGGASSEGQIETLDKSLEDLLTRVDEFVGMLDMIRSDSSQVVNESVPHIHAKAVEMRQLYRKIDKLEAFVKMVGNSVAVLEEQITKAETDLGTFPNTLKKILHTINVPSFLNKPSSSRQNQATYEPPDLFKTEDYFPCLGEAQRM